MVRLIRILRFNNRNPESVEVFTLYLDWFFDWIVIRSHEVQDKKQAVQFKEKIWYRNLISAWIKKASKYMALKVYTYYCSDIFLIWSS